jgi:hypothetical protein
MNSAIASWTSKIGKAPDTYGIALQKFLSLCCQVVMSVYVWFLMVNCGAL